MTIDIHLMVRHNVWSSSDTIPFDAAPPAMTYGPSVSVDELQEIHATLHDDAIEIDHEYAFGG